jgi:hypothetical protein
MVAYRLGTGIRFRVTGFGARLRREAHICQNRPDMGHPNDPTRAKPARMGHPAGLMSRKLVREQSQSNRRSFDCVCREKRGKLRSG